jgi:ubiquinone/menaquinone biosynthesis C-methylase UbiE
MISKPDKDNNRPINNHDRRKWQNPEAILSNIGLRTGFILIDIGCGSGFFTLPAARIVGKTGKVYGVDANSESIASLNEQAAREGIKNLYLTTGKAEESVICTRCGDIVFFGMALHDFQDPSRVLENARVMIKRNGRLVNLDWKKKPMELGPPLNIRFDEETAVRLIKEAGFTVEIIKDSGPYHYIVIARP